MTDFKTLDDLPDDLTGKRVLVRVDLNVPMQDGAVTDDTRLRATAADRARAGRPRRDRAAAGAFRPAQGRARPDMSTAQLVHAAVASCSAARCASSRIARGPRPSGRSTTMLPGDIAILENTRFHAGEEKNDPELAKAMAALGDYYVNDAFSAAHRAHASTEGVAHLLPAYAGRAMEAELKALEKALGNPERPVAAVVGGAKVSTKLAVLEPPRRQGRSSDHRRRHGQHLPRRARRRRRQVAVRARSGRRGRARSSTRAEAAGCTVHLPYDVVVAKEFAANPPSLRTCNVHEVAADEMILDVGPAAVEALADVLKTCRTLVWNGPLGAFETPPFDAATVALARTAAALTQEGSAGLGRRRRRHRRGAQPCRRGRRFHLRLDRRRRLPRMDGRPRAARRRRASTATEDRR